MDDPVSTLEYEINPDGFGAPCKVRLNGQLIEGVVRIDTCQADGEFSVATLRLGGVRVNVKNRESSDD